ncbi:MAG TPA: tetratricopeptide repeat protein [Gemmatimonadales bacterium]|nr:tetratricopeptide repeat protein [Gemmatimonadales bacterium]
MSGKPGQGGARGSYALITALALAAAGGGLRNGFVYDDIAAIVQNPLVHSLAGSARIWTSSYWPAGLLYRPLTIQLFAVEWWLGGGAAWPFHLTNVVLYAIVAGLVYRLARRLTSGEGALAAGSLFAAHPVHVEVVANSVGQSELLASSAILLGVDRYLAWRERGGLGVGRRAALALLCAGAIAAKETGYVFPILLAAAEVFVVADPTPRRDRRRAVVPVFALLLAVTVIGLLVRVVVFTELKGETVSLPLRGLGAGERAIAMLAVVPQWARLLLWPAHLQAEYGPPGVPISASPGVAHLLGAGWIAAAAALLAWAWSRAPVVGLGVAWAAIALLPVSNLLTATGVLLAERNLFLPSVGAALAAGGLVTIVARRGAGTSRPVGVLALRGALLALGIAGVLRSAGRTAVWRDQAGFFERLERDAPRAYRAHLVAGKYFLSAGRLPAAESAFSSARALYRDDPAVYEELGQIYRSRKRCDRAVPIFTEGLGRHPDAILLRSRLIECLLAVGDTGRARTLAREAVDRGQSEFAAALRRLER